MSDLLKAKDHYKEQTILKRVIEESERTGENFQTIVESTMKLKETIGLHQQIEDDLDTSKRKLFLMKLTSNKELLIFYSGLAFYICVIIYIIIRRGPIAWLLHLIFPSEATEDMTNQPDL